MACRLGGTLATAHQLQEAARRAVPLPLFGQGEGAGLSHLFGEAREMFPLKAEPLLQMLAALARASEDSARKVRAP